MELFLHDIRKYINWIDLNFQNMMELKKYEAPAILEDVSVEVACGILAKSIVTKDTEVESVGQEVVDHTMTGYDHSWE